MSDALEADVLRAQLSAKAIEVSRESRHDWLLVPADHATTAVERHVATLAALPLDPRRAA